MSRSAFFAFTILCLTFNAMAAEPGWIWSKPGEAGPNASFRKTISLAEPAKAVLIAAGDNEIQVWINDKPVVRKHTKWETPTVQNVTTALRPGDNVIAVSVKNADGPGAALVQLTVQDKKKGELVFGTDSSWLTTDRLAKGWRENGFDDSAWRKSVVLAPLGGDPWKVVNAEQLAALGNLKEPEATPVERIRLADGFKAELLYSVPKDEQGSWVSMTVDDKGRLILSDQYGGLYRLTPGKTSEDTVVEPLGIELGQSHGLLYAFGSLYAVVSNKAYKGRGLYRAQDTDGDDKFDKVELLKKFAETGGEHGPHGPVLGPDGKSIYVVSGNQTAPPEVDSSRVPLHWAEDLLLPRIYGRGFMKTAMAPGGWIAKTDPDGREWELFATGFRNQYDVAFNREGDMFTYDADMEWDMNVPWYRPTRVCHVTSGSEWGWRNGSGKWPEYYGDSLPPVVNVGPGSPTGITFGYGSKFPEAYEKALFVSDWSYGKLYAIHLEPDGSTYFADVEEFMSAQPLPLTDLAINPKDGAMYVAIGGRRVQSGVYRVTWVGDKPEEIDTAATQSHERTLRHSLEHFHGRQDPQAIPTALEHIGSEDRFIRFAARIALEHQPVDQWQEKALRLSDPRALITAMIGLARTADASAQPEIIAALASVDWKKLDWQDKQDLFRAYSLAFTRMGEPSAGMRERVITHLSHLFPTRDLHLNVELSQLLLYLNAPGAVEKTMVLLNEEPTQEGQISFAKNLRLSVEGWTPELRENYFDWFVRAANYKGGPSFDLFIQYIKNDAVAQLSDEEKKALQPILDKKPEPKRNPYQFKPRNFVKAWTVEDFDDVIHVGLEGGRSLRNGRNMFGAGTCFVCHRFNGTGGAVGPDLTSAGGRFSPRDLLETIIEPSKEISDQYGSIVVTKHDGSQVVGRIMNLSGDNMKLNVNMMDPNSQVDVDQKQVKSIEPSTISMMPPGLVNTMSKDDVLDLLAYILSRGSAEDPMFAE